MPTFTDRQIEILQAMSHGMMTNDIAKKIGISADTVKQHKHVIYERMGVKTAAHAVAVALRDKIIN